MIPRRSMFSAAALGAVAVAATPRATETAAQDIDLGPVVRAVEGVSNELRRQRNACSTGECPEIERVREQQRIHLKAAQKYPDYIEVGVDVWERMYDWHVRNAQPLVVTRLPDGRYGLQFMMTMLVLRPDFAANFVGPATDKL